MKPVKFIPLSVVAVGFFLVGAVSVISETEIANPNDALNKHFAIASERYGKDEIQLHSRQEGADGPHNKVYSINCARVLFREVFDGTSGPADFPVQSQDAPSEPIENDSKIAPLAAHVCKQHGVPLVGIQW